MMYELLISEDALNDITKLKKTGDKAALGKLDKLLDELREHTTTGTGQPEQLKYGFSGMWSRRITDKHRLIYRIEERQVRVIVIQAYGHY